MALITVVNRDARPYAKTVTVNENRAPTDESVRLLREMEEQAQKRVIAVWRPEVGNVIGVVVQIQKSEMTLDSDLWVQIKINGDLYEYKEPGPDRRMVECEGHHAFIEGLNRALTAIVRKTVAQAMTTGTMRTEPKKDTNA